MTKKTNPLRDNMMGIRTPPKGRKADMSFDIDTTGPSNDRTYVTQPTKVRRSIGEWEKTASQRTSSTSPKEVLTALKEARKWQQKAKLHLNNSKNLKNEIKVEVIAAIDGLYNMVQKIDMEKTQLRKDLMDIQHKNNKKASKNLDDDKILKELARHGDLLKRNAERMIQIEEAITQKREGAEPTKKATDSVVIEKLTQHSELLLESSKRLGKLEETLEAATAVSALTSSENGSKIDDLKEIIQKTTAVNGAHLKESANEALSYASVTASRRGSRSDVHRALHSVVVTYNEGGETGEQVLNRVREVINAKSGDINIERVRKAKDSKIIIGCKTEGDRNALKDKLKAAKDTLKVEDATNKDPLIVLNDVLKNNKDEDILKAMRNQNKTHFRDLQDAEDRMSVKYRKNAKNPLTQHVVLTVSPVLWRRFVDSAFAYIDLQRVKVYDQSPLVQCSLCLGYGHSRRYCSGGTEKCSHCGEAHKKTDCDALREGKAPKCCNCTAVKADNPEHNAFSRDCPVRLQWDALARATVAYC